jgi:hypothetical protein
MFKVFLFSLIVVLTGCSTTSYQTISPTETSNIPIDCWNRKQILNWLDQQLAHAEKDAKANEANIKAVKYKIWEIRTTCNR